MYSMFAELGFDLIKLKKNLFILSSTDRLWFGPSHCLPQYNDCYCCSSRKHPFKNFRDAAELTVLDRTQIRARFRYVC